jgi:hypothetical protein
MTTIPPDVPQETFTKILKYRSLISKSDQTVLAHQLRQVKQKLETFNTTLKAREVTAELWLHFRICS